MSDDTTTAIGRPKGSRTAAGPIRYHPMYDEIHKRLFIDRQDVMAVYRWLVSKDAAAGISYHMLYRFKKSQLETAIAERVMADAQSSAKRNWEVLDSLIIRFQESLDAGEVPNGKDAIAAIKLQQELIEKYGTSPFQAEQAAREKLRKIIGWVEQVMTDEQKETFAEFILDDPDLAEWVLPDD